MQHSNHTEKYCQIVGSLPDFGKHFSIDTLDVIGHFHVVRKCQPVEHLLFVVDVTVIVYVLA